MFYKDNRFLLLQKEHFRIQMDIIRYYLSINSAALNFCEQDNVDFGLKIYLLCGYMRWVYI